MEKNSWKKSRLFQALQERKDATSVALLSREDVMDKIETILDKGGTMPKDFTLHDSDHSFRVAERMWEIIPESTRASLTAHELTLLLLSAYLHDIGMSPDFDTVLRHRDFLLSEER